MDNEAVVHWLDCKSSNGNDYSVGYLSADDLEKAKQIEPDASPSMHDFDIAVTWEPSDGWVMDGGEVERKAAIVRHHLIHPYDQIYNHKLRFTNYEHYDYHFCDKTGDWYRVNTFSNSDHFVRYNSRHGVIVHIRVAK